MKSATLISWLVLLVLSHKASAVNIVDQALDPTSPGGYSNLDPADNIAQQLADDFSLPAAGTLETIAWQGRYGSGQVMPKNPVAFAIRFFADDGGNPSLPVVSYTQESRRW